MGEAKKDYIKRVEEERKETLLNKKLCRKRLRNRRRLSNERLWQWLRAQFFEIKDRVLFVQHKNKQSREDFTLQQVRKKIESKFKVYSQKVESIEHLDRGCSGLVKKGIQ